VETDFCCLVRVKGKVLQISVEDIFGRLILAVW
jgi:hypothetical protein